MSQVLEKLAEYETAGVENIWLVDPRLELLSVYESGDLKRLEKLMTADGIAADCAPARRRTTA